MSSGTWVHRWMIGYGNFLFRYRNYIFPLVLLGIILATSPATAVPGVATLLVGFLVVLSGQAVRCSVIGLEYIKRGGVDKKVAAENLVVSGMFAHCRNPLYVGNLLILCGLLIMYDNAWACLAGTAYFVLSYTAIVLAEEYFLAGKFGPEYTEYCRRVPRWWIRIRGLRATLAGHEFNWRRVVNKDYTTMTTWMLTAILLLLRRGFAEHPDLPRSGLLLVAGIAVVLVLLFASSVKWLKSSGRLR